jgi:CubicO group peptidase (beta-lactamase class C family)
MAWEMSGTWGRRFWPLAEAFRDNFDQGLELGASLAVTWRGRTVVDVWGGWADVERTRSWRKDTIVQVFSTTKIMIVTAVLILVDRGKIDLDAPVARYWPEFAQGGKGEVTVRDFLTHRGGVPGFRPQVGFEDLHDWKRMTAQLAAQPHWFGGKKVICYHAVTYGYVLGELIRRVTGRSPARFFRDEVARPAGADFQLGLTSRSDVRRVALLDLMAAGPPPGMEVNPLAMELIGDALANGDLMSWGRLSAVMPGANGYGNGRSIARVCATFAMNGKVRGHRFMSPAMVAEAATEQVYGDDLYIGRISWGLGFGLNSPDYPAPSPTAFHWGGAGGSWGVMDPKAQVSLGYAPNRLLGGAGAALDPRLARLSAALSALLPGLSR